MFKLPRRDPGLFQGVFTPPALYFKRVSSTSSDYKYLYARLTSSLKFLEVQDSSRSCHSILLIVFLSTLPRLHIQFRRLRTRKLTLREKVSSEGAPRDPIYKFLNEKLEKFRDTLGG